MTLFLSYLLILVQDSDILRIFLIFLICDFFYYFYQKIFPIETGNKYGKRSINREAFNLY